MPRLIGSIVFDVETDLLFSRRLSFRFHLQPVALQRARSGKFGFYTPKKSVLFKKELVRQLRGQWKEKPLDQALYVECTFKIERPKTVKRVHHTITPDCSNLIKGLEDAFNKILWKDDSYITHLTVIKKYDESNGIDLDVYCLR